MCRVCPKHLSWLKLVVTGTQRRTICSLELVQIRRQLEYSIAEQRGQQLVKAPTTREAVNDIVNRSGVLGLYNGFRLHLGEYCSLVTSVNLIGFLVAKT